ncbi:hypothetical protein [Luteimonas terrae]|uniref:Uncharacterized protein n=1 Tax=Luteimonas terrae TaxID=1530191 RepID=A0ABU1XY38_9GAMM|nr:hypothetical protein [Luteimonas terrae]MDR7193682.1 hypothetical protein [Luteimonas terrae]
MTFAPDLRGLVDGPRFNRAEPDSGCDRHAKFRIRGFAVLDEIGRARRHAWSLLVDDTRNVYQPVHAVYDRISGVSSRIRAFVDFIADALTRDPAA